MVDMILDIYIKKYEYIITIFKYFYIISMSLKRTLYLEHNCTSLLLLDTAVVQLDSFHLSTTTYPRRLMNFFFICTNKDCSFRSL